MFGMKTVFVMWLVASATALAETNVAVAVKRSEALYSETIPHLKIKKASLEEALVIIRNIWKLKHPSEPFPVGLTDYEPADNQKERARRQITLDLKNVPYIEALRFVGQLSFRRLIEKNGFAQFEQIVGIQEDWTTEVYHLTPAVLAGLRLRDDSSSEQVQKAFESYGVEFPKGMKATLADSGNILIVRNLTEQLQRIAGIVLLLRNGFEIRKDKAEPSGAANGATPR